MRQCRSPNKEQPNALPCLGVASEAEGKNIITLVGSVGYGEMEGRHILNGFYQEALADTGEMVERIYEAGKWLSEVRDWQRADLDVRGEFPQNPLRFHDFLG